MADMTPDEIAEMRRIIKAATKGPWQVQIPRAAFSGLTAPTGPVFFTAPPENHDAARLEAGHIFCSAARTGWPKALDEIERLRRELHHTQEINADIAMNGHRWMVAHDRLQAGKPYTLPSPADLPAAEAARDEAVKLISHLKDEFDIRIIPHIREGKCGLAVSLCKAISASIDAFLATQPKPEGENP